MPDPDPRAVRWRETRSDRRKSFRADPSAGSGRYARWWWEIGVARIIEKVRPDGR